MRLPFLLKKDGPITLNGPVVEGFVAKARVYVGPGVIMGCDVLIMATEPEVAEGIAAYLDEQSRSKATHVLMGQPPWFQNQTRDNDLDDIIATDHKRGPPPPKRRSLL